MVGMPLPACRLCGAVPCVSSHVFPDFFIRGVEFELPKGKTGGPQVHSRLLSTRPAITGGVRQRGGWERELGMKEPLLCAKCDNEKVGGWESWFKDFFYGNSPGPIRKSSSGIIHPFEERIRVRQVEYASFKLFVLSLVWRASIASGAFFQGVDIGRAHEVRLAAALFAGDPGAVDFYPLGMMQFEDGYGLEDVIEEPDIIRDENGFKMCRIIAGGFGFLAYLLEPGQQLAPENLQACPQPSGQLVIGTIKGIENASSWVRNLVAKNMRPSGMDGP
jgi:hypothetical protein